MKNLGILALLCLLFQSNIKIFASDNADDNKNDNKSLKAKEHLNLVPLHLTMNGRITSRTRALPHQPNSLDSLEFSEHLLSMNSQSSNDRRAIFIDASHAGRSSDSDSQKKSSKLIDSKIIAKNENNEDCSLDNKFLSRPIKLLIFGYVGGDNWVYNTKINTDEKIEKIRSLCFLNENNIAIGLVNGNIEIWDYLNSKLLANLTNKTAGHDYSVVSLLLEPKNNILISGDLEGKVFLWNLNSIGKVYNDITRSGGIKAICLINLPQKIYIALGLEHGVIELVDLNTLFFIDITQTQEIIRLRDDNSQEITQLIASPDNKYIVSGSSDSLIKIWDIKERKLLQTINNSYGRVISLKWINKDLDLRNVNNILIAAFNDKLIAKWNMNFVLNPQKLKNLPIAQKISAMQFLTYFNKYLVAQEDSKIKIFSDDEKFRFNFEFDSSVQFNEQFLLSENEELLVFTSNSNEILFYRNIGNKLLSLFGLLEERSADNNVTSTNSSNRNRQRRSGSNCIVM